MTDTNDGTTTETTPEGEGSETTPDQKGSAAEDPVALARKRQAGAEAARQQAEKELKEARKRIEEFEAATRTSADKDLADNAKLQERLAAAERRAEQAEQKAQARILDTLYPNARKELPEVTDEVRLAKFEALLREDDSPAGGEPPAPQRPNETNRTASSDTAPAAKEESSEDILARLKAMGMPQGW